MAFPSVTYTFANSTTADATQVNQNFTDIINGVSDGTKNISVSAGTFAGTLNAQGAVTLGSSSSNLITFTGSLNSTINIGTNNSFDVGSLLFGLSGLYLGSASSKTTKLVGAATSSYTLTFPVTGGTSGYVMKTDGSGTTSWIPQARGNPTNYSLAASVATNAMTIALKDAVGSDPSASSSVDVIFRNATATTGTPQTLVSITAAMSVVIPSGATLGLTSAVNQYIYVYLIQDTSNELAVSGSRIFDDGSLQSATAITNGSTSSTVLYATGNHTSRPVKFLGRIQSNQTVSGTYAAAATEISSDPILPPLLSDWQAFTMSVTGSSSNPTLGTLVSNKAIWRRVGDSMEIVWAYSQTSVGGAAGSGTYLFTIPGGFSIDSTKATLSSTLGLTCVGTATGKDTSANQYNGYVASYDSTHLAIALFNTTAGGPSFAGSAWLSLNSTIQYGFCAVVPISGWSSSR